MLDWIKKEVVFYVIAPGVLLVRLFVTLSTLHLVLLRCLHNYCWETVMKYSCQLWSINVEFSKYLKKY